MIPSAIPATRIADGSVDNTEFQYLNGVTSSIQTQLDAKGVDYVSKTNNSGGTIEPGAPVYLEADGKINKARADSTATADVYGLAGVSIPNATSGNVYHRPGSRLSLTTGEWDAITGAAGGLTPNQKYWLSAATAGRLVTTIPSTAGQQVVLVGVGESTTVMKLILAPYIGL